MLPITTARMIFPWDDGETDRLRFSLPPIEGFPNKYERWVSLAAAGQVCVLLEYCWWWCLVVVVVLGG